MTSDVPNRHWRQAALVAAYDLRGRLGSRATWALAVFAAASAVFVVDSIVGPVEALEGWLAPGDEATAAQVAAHVAESSHLKALVTWVGDGDAERASYWLEHEPALLTGIVLVLLMLTPLLTALGAFDQTAGDVGSRWMRFVLARTERTSVFAGRLASAAAGICALLAVLLLVVTVYLDVRLSLYPRGSLYAWGLQGVLALSLLSLPHAALCAWVSAVHRSALRALAWSVVAVAAPITALGVVTAQWDVPGWIVRLHPWGWKYELLDPDPGTRALATAVMLGFTAAIAAAGAATFQRRDV